MSCLKCTWYRHTAQRGGAHDEGLWEHQSHRSLLLLVLSGPTFPLTLQCLSQKLFQQCEHLRSWRGNFESDAIEPMYENPLATERRRHDTTFGQFWHAQFGIWWNGMHSQRRCWQNKSLVWSCHIGRCHWNWEKTKSLCHLWWRYEMNHPCCCRKWHGTCFLGMPDFAIDRQFTRFFAQKSTSICMQCQTNRLFNHIR